MVTFAIDPRKSAVVAIDLQNCEHVAGGEGSCERGELSGSRAVSATLLFLPPPESERATKALFFESYCSLGFEQAAAASRQAAALGSVDPLVRQAMDQLKVKRKV